MAGAKMTRTRGRYVSAGYVAGGGKAERRTEESACGGEQERELYIAKVPAGSAQDDLRDLNKPGYRSERPWREAPSPVFEEPYRNEEEPVEQPRKRAHTRISRHAKRRTGLLEQIAEEARRDKKGAAMCVALFAVCLMLGSAWGQKMVEGVQIQQMIDSYQAQTANFEQENEQLAQQLEMAKSGERIRNLAQNELGMLRPERAQTETIYIQAPETPTQEMVQESEEPQMDLLDFLLGMLNVFHIGE